MEADRLSNQGFTREKKKEKKKKKNEIIGRIFSPFKSLSHIIETKKKRKDRSSQKA